MSKSFKYVKDNILELKYEDTNASYLKVALEMDLHGQRRVFFLEPGIEGGAFDRDMQLQLKEHVVPASPMFTDTRVYE